MGRADLVAPVASSNRDDGKLGEDDGTTDGGGHFLAALDAQTNVSIGIADGDKGLKASALSRTGLLLNGHDLQHLVGEGRAEKVVNDFGLLDGQRKSVNLLKALDLAFEDQTA